MCKENYEERMFVEIMSKRIGCVPVLLLCAALSFVGCKTIRESEIVEIHDTVTTHKVDTVREYKLKTLYDTVHHWHTSEVTLRENGDTIRHVVNNYYKERVVERDSTDRYRSSIDSLRAVLNQLHDRQTAIERKPGWWERWKWRLAMAALLIAVALAAKGYVAKFADKIKRLKQP